MDFAAVGNIIVYALDAVLLGIVAYGGYLVLGGGGFHRDVPEITTHPRLDRLFTH
jgi:hypothetical protein